MHKFLAALGFASCLNLALAGPNAEVICTYAPSQSNTVAVVSGVVGGTGVTAGAIAAATGLTAVVHSSGALILTGSSGYVASTLGAAASAVSAAPIVLGVGLIVGGTAVTLELVCAAKNHPDQVKKVNAAAEEFSRRFAEAIAQGKHVGGKMKQPIVPAAGNAVIAVKQGAAEAWQYAYRKSVDIGKLLER